MSIEGRTERTIDVAREGPQHACPHEGQTSISTRADDNLALYCGDWGWLCPACREDKADARTDRLVEGMALAGILSNPNSWGEAESDVVKWSKEHAAALRER